MEKIISEKGWRKLEGLIAVAENNYMESVKMVAHYGADQDGWHGEAYGMHYAEQLKKMDELMRLKKIQHDFHVQQKKPKGDRVEIGCIVEIDIGGKRQEIIFDGFSYKDKIKVVTPDSPIGKEMYDLKVGESFYYKDILINIVSIKVSI